MNGVVLDSSSISKSFFSMEKVLVKKYKCNVCCMSFVKQGNLKLHLASHKHSKNLAKYNAVKINK